MRSRRSTTKKTFLTIWGPAATAKSTLAFVTEIRRGITTKKATIALTREQKTITMNAEITTIVEITVKGRTNLTRRRRDTARVKTSNRQVKTARTTGSIDDQAARGGKYVPKYGPLLSICLS